MTREPDESRRRAPAAAGVVLGVLAAALAACGPDAPPAAPNAVPAPPAEVPRPRVSLRLRLAPFDEGGALSAADADVARDRLVKRLKAAGIDAEVTRSTADELTVFVSPDDTARVRTLVARTGAFEIRLTATAETERAVGDTSPPTGLRRIPGRASSGPSGSSYLIEFAEELPMDDVEGARPDVFTDADVASASVAPTGGQSVLEFEIVADRKEAFRAFTGKSLGRRLAFVVDGEVLSAPTIRSELPGLAVIEGGGVNGFTAAEAHELAAILNSGRLPCRVQPLE